MKIALITAFAVLACSLALAGESTGNGTKSNKWPSRNPIPYKDAPAVVAKLKALGERSALTLGKFKITPADATKWHFTFKNGPSRRGFCNKMPYAPDRKTALYAGGDHGTPHRLNDAWEFHLGSNSWNLICPPVNDAYRLNMKDRALKRAKDALAKGKDVEKNKAYIEKTYPEYAKKWWGTCTVKDGYLQADGNGGPIMPWHTWDGLTYDQRTKRLYWAVLDSDNFKTEKYRVHRSKTRNYAKWTGKDPAKLLAQLKPGTSMYMYDPAKGRWTKQMGKGPFPIMRAMGGTLHYLPDIDKTIWYACVGCTPGGYEEGMWAYDAKTNKWSNLIKGVTIGGLMRKKKAPGGELQAAYSIKHQTLLAVQKEMTFAYDVKANSWARVADNPGWGWDSISVFDYDSNADVFILVSKPGGRWSQKPWTLAAYDIATNKWETVNIKGTQLPQDPPKKAWLAQSYAGYYDPGHNAFVLYAARTASTWVYRHKKTAPKTSDVSDAPKPAATSSFRTPQSAVRTPKQVCTGWLSSARNYRKVGMLADARRCLNNIVKTYPDTEWATRARRELSSL
jgi:hypothetical protein